MRNSNEIVSVFVDINNLYLGGMKKYGARLDYKKFLTKLEEHGTIRVAFAYGFGTDSGIESFKALLRHTGFEIRWAQVRYNWNVDIAMDVMRQLDRVDLVVLASSDPNLTACVEYIKQEGVKCYAYGFKISSPIKNIVDRYFEIPKDLLITENENASQP